MLFKAFIGLATLIGAAFYYFGDAAYSREVGASPAQVRAALADLDLTKAPGAPGSDPMAAGGAAPMLQLSQTERDMVWTVMSGERVAARLIAHLEPLDGGARTRVTTDYQRGNAPDDFVSPAFRSKGVSLGLFAIVLEDELDRLTRPANADPAACEKILAEFEAGAPPMVEQTGFAGVARTSLKLHALESKLKAAGCDTGFNDEFREVRSELDEHGGSGSSPRAEPAPGEFGKPMIDLSEKR